MNKIIDLCKIVHSNLVMIIREHYLKQIRGFYESDLIKIITGVRRCRKSIVLKQIMNEIEKSLKILFI